MGAVPTWASLEEHNGHVNCRSAVGRAGRPSRVGGVEVCTCGRRRVLTVPLTAGWLTGMDLTYATGLSTEATKRHLARAVLLSLLVLVVAELLLMLLLLLLLLML